MVATLSFLLTGFLRLSQRLGNLPTLTLFPPFFAFGLWRCRIQAGVCAERLNSLTGPESPGFHTEFGISQSRPFRI